MSRRNTKPPTDTSELSLKPPRFVRKTGAYTSREQQLLASQEATNLSDSKCSGRLTGHGMVVCSPPDIAALVRVGSYGKGIFSRSVPCHGQLPLFRFPRRIDRVKDSRFERDKSEATDISLSTEVLTEHELDTVQKMSQFLETRERAIKLHAEWEKEAEQMEDERNSKLSLNEQYNCDVEKNHATKLDVEPLSEKSTDLQTDSNVQLQAVMSETSSLTSDRVSPSSTTVMETDCTKKIESSMPSVTVLPGLSFEEHYGQFKERIDLLDKSDPYKLSEYLQLGNEEAFYLSHRLKILEVQSDDGKKTLNVDELWDHFCSGNENFVPRYVAYSYYRERGWVPRSGIKFGVDFVLYKQGPITHHSSYAVVVRMISEESRETTRDRDTKTRQASLFEPDTCSSTTDQTRQTGLTWRDIIAFDRVSKSVVKDLIMCYIVNHHAEEMKQFPECLEKLSVSEVFVKRWEPEKERD